MIKRVIGQMPRKFNARTRLLALCLMMVCASGSPGFAAGSEIKVTDIRTASGISDQYEPVGAAAVFPLGTAKVYCWFQWENAPDGTALKARWTYLTKKIKIFEYPVSIPKTAGAGGIAMAMPKGRSLPPGAYRVELLDDKKKPVKSLDFSVGT
jgi:hypothetical protein